MADCFGPMLASRAMVIALRQWWARWRAAQWQDWTPLDEPMEGNP